MSKSAALHTALSLLDQALDKTEADFNVTPGELEIIRKRRALEMLTAANELYNAVTGRRTR